MVKERVNDLSEKKCEICKVTNRSDLVGIIRQDCLMLMSYDKLECVY